MPCKTVRLVSLIVADQFSATPNLSIQYLLFISIGRGPREDAYVWDMAAALREGGHQTMACSVTQSVSCAGWNRERVAATCPWGSAGRAGSSAWAGGSVLDRSGDFSKGLGTILVVGLPQATSKGCWAFGFPGPLGAEVP